MALGDYKSGGEKTPERAKFHPSNAGDLAVSFRQLQESEFRNRRLFLESIEIQQAEQEIAEIRRRLADRESERGAGRIGPSVFNSFRDEYDAEIRLLKKRFPQLT